MIDFQSFNFDGEIFQSALNNKTNDDSLWKAESRLSN
jgi:hypothetical protein